MRCASTLHAWCGWQSIHRSQSLIHVATCASFSGANHHVDGGGGGRDGKASHARGGLHRKMRQPRRCNPLVGSGRGWTKPFYHFTCYVVQCQSRNEARTMQMPRDDHDLWKCHHAWKGVNLNEGLRDARGNKLPPLVAHPDLHWLTTVRRCNPPRYTPGAKGAMGGAGGTPGKPG